jgi:hypothetical protein
MYLIEGVVLVSLGEFLVLNSARQQLAIRLPQQKSRLGPLRASSSRQSLQDACRLAEKQSIQLKEKSSECAVAPHTISEKQCMLSKT